MRTNELEKKIDQLQIDVKKALAKKEELKENLADIFEAGTEDPAATLKKLAEIKDSIEGQISALRVLSKKKHIVQNEENQSQELSLQKEENQLYQSTMKNIISKLEPVRKILSNTVQKNALPALMSKIHDDIGAAAWLAIDDDFAIRFLKEVPLPSPGIQQWDNEANRIETPVAAIGMESRK
jgi:chromosome segregation ATPase